MKYELTRKQLEEMVLCIVHNHLDESEAMEYALSVCGEFTSEDAEVVWPESEQRIDIIGTNGNTAEHYEVTA
ncbi:MAG: hypothetical protein WA981_03605 [Glaciecola sp.]